MNWPGKISYHKDRLEIENRVIENEYVVQFHKLTNGATAPFTSTLYVRAKKRFEALLKAYRRASQDSFNCKIVGVRYIVNLSGPAAL